MRAHWNSWITEDHIIALKNRGVQMVRLPIGDWTILKYEPYEGCMNGAEDKIDWFMDTCEKHGIKVFMTIQALEGS